jgi:hypothetical protein
MSDVFYVVSKTANDAPDYVAAVAFTASHEGADNESAAAEYCEEMRAAKPWQTHAVVSASDFKSASESATATDEH